MKSIKENREITLIALAVTIVVLLILAAITITFILGEDGIINKAKEASNAMNNAVINDQASLNSISDTINGMVNRAGESGDSNTETPDPEPEGPEWEGPTGIQDETVETEDGYGNKVTIPKGFEVVEEEGTTVPEGIVIQDKDGNQFVWIPVGRVYKDSTGTNYSDIQLGRYTFDENDGTPTLVQAAYTEEKPNNYEEFIAISNDEEVRFYEYDDRSTPNGYDSPLADTIAHKDDLNAIAKDLAGFVNSVKDNGGYYLARYEASYGSGSSISDYKPLSMISTGTPRTSNSYSGFNKGGLTKGRLWNYVHQIDAAKISKNMYNNDSSVGVESDLVNSYAWDTAIVFIQEMGNKNYSNANRDTIGNTNIMNTGTTGDEACNIFDMASNCAELTTEYCSYVYNKASPCVVRGGSYSSTSYFRNPAYRRKMPFHDGGSSYEKVDMSFRVVLYIK